MQKPTQTTAVRKAPILVVDDDPGILASMVRLLRRDFDVLTASSGVEAVTVLRTREIPILVTDQRMPNMSGAQLLAAVAEISPQTVGVLITGYSDIEAVVEAINLGQVFRYHRKPWDQDALLASLRAALAQYEAERRRAEELERLKSHLQAEVARQSQQLHAQTTRLLEIEQIKNRFLDNVSHQLRTPLAILKTSLDLLQRGRAERRQHYLDMATDATRDLETMILEALDFADINLGPGDLDLEATPIGSFVEQAANSHRLLALGKDIELKVENRLPPDADLQLPLDRALFSKALDNLLVNAIRFAPKHGCVEVGVGAAFSEQGPVVAIWVHDDGPGIDEKEMELLFTPFFRGADAKHGWSPGLGLGLALAAAIVRWHGSQIEVVSAEGSGSTFSIRFPCRPLDQEPPHDSHEH